MTRSQRGTVGHIGWVVALVACSSGSGGESGAGGTPATGGTSATISGPAPAGSVAPGAGGTSAAGGSVTAGGSVASGGTGTGTSGGGTTTGPAGGGAVSSGGTVTSGGAVSSGGTVTSGGAVSSGGTVTSGGGSAGPGQGTAGEAPAQAGAAAGGSATQGDGGAPAQPGGNAGATGLTATEAAAAMGKGFNLGQMFESTQHTPSLASAGAKIDAYYARGFRNVRIPVTWTEPVGGSLLVGSATVGDVDRGNPRLAVLEQVVDHALAYPDLYVIINAHHESTLKTENRWQAFERLWQDIVDIFGGREHRLLFELLNEPHQSDADNSPMPPEELRNMVARAYSKIRAVDPERVVLIGGNQWFAANEMAEVWPDLEGVGGGDDPYVMATFHHYDPWTFCGDNQGDYADPWTESNLADPMDTMLTWASEVGRGMPVHIGEWGVGWGSRYGQMDCNNVRAWYQQMVALHAEPRGIPTSVWDDGGWFKIFDHAAGDFANNLVDCISGDCEWDGTERFNAGCD